MNSFTNLIGLLFILGVFLGRSIAPRHSMMCLDCKDIRHRESCKTYKHCLEACKTEVHFVNGHYTFSFGCGGHHACENSVGTHVFGRKRGPHDNGDLVCTECCTSTGCDKHTCSRYRTPPTTTTTTTTRPTPAPTTASSLVTVTQTLCSDNEVQDFSCSDWESFGFCDETSGAGYSIAKERCQETCGFCY